MRKVLLSVALPLFLSVPTQGQPRPRIGGPVDGARMITVPHSTHPLVTSARDLGRVEGTLPMERITLVLQTSPEQQAALDQFLAEQQDSSSSHYHEWLTPEQFGERFGASMEDITTITDWLREQGFEVGGVASGRRSIEFSGTARQVEEAFRTEIHNYLINGERHVSNSIDISIPEALMGVVDGVVSLHDFRAQPLHHVITPGDPAFNLNGGVHGLAPNDFAAIYNVSGLWGQGITGAGQSIAILGRTNIKVSDVNTFRSTLGLAPNPPQIILNGVDPGINNDEIEADLDVEWAGAVAKAAAIKLVISAGTRSADGIDLSAQYAVNHHVAPVISLSYGACEAQLGSYSQFYNNLWQQAAMQGISVFVSAGDSGAAACDSASESKASGGLAINGLASTPYNVAVGGTQFNDPAGSWNGNGSPAGYIPESAWNQSGGGGLWAGGGGASMVYATPAWQAGSGVPADRNHRYVPDVSLAASTHDGYLVQKGGSLYLVGGTSASAPAFAGIMALVNQFTNAANGNPNPRLYPLAAQDPAAFHDVTSGSNAVPCAAASSNCSNGTLTGYSAGAGYDLATGLGSVNAFSLANAWGNVQVPPSITALSPNPMITSPSSQVLTINGTGFRNGAIVAVGSGTMAATVLSGSRITVTLNMGSAQTLNVHVTNPNGQPTNTVTLTVNAPVPPASIGSLSPNPMTASSRVQTLVVNGSGFVIGATVTLGGQIATATFVSSSKLTIGVTATGPLTTSVHVTNPNGPPSNTVTLTVNAPALTPPPAITSLSPNPMTKSTAAQTLTINGSGFENGATVKIGAASGQVAFVSAAQVTIRMIISTAQTWNVQLINPSGLLSNTLTLRVQ